jgi:hypothetical protein
MVCYKLVKDMHYEACVQAVISYCAEYENRSVKKGVARDLLLTWEQYLKVNKYHLYSFILILILQYMSYTSLHLGASELVHRQGRVLVYDGRQVDQRGVGPPARLMPGATFDDAGPSTSSREP